MLVILRVLLKWTDVSEIHTASIIRAMEAVLTSETSVCLYKATRRCFPEGCRIHLNNCQLLKNRLLGVTEVIWHEFCY